MCGGGAPLPPATNPAAERAATEAQATATANAQSAYDRRAKKRQSLLAAGADGAAPVAAQNSSVLAYGKDKLGS